MALVSTKLGREIEYSCPLRSQMYEGDIGETERQNLLVRSLDHYVITYLRKNDGAHRIMKPCRLYHFVMGLWCGIPLCCNVFFCRNYKKKAPIAIHQGCYYRDDCPYVHCPVCALEKHPPIPAEEQRGKDSLPPSEFEVGQS